MWLVHNLNLPNLERLTKLAQIQTYSIPPHESFFFWLCLKRVPPFLPSLWNGFSLFCWFCVIRSKSHATLWLQWAVNLVVMSAFIFIKLTQPWNSICCLRLFDCGRSSCLWQMQANYCLLFLVLEEAFRYWRRNRRPDHKFSSTLGVTY